MEESFLLHQCKCGYYYLIFNDNLFYGPLTDIPVAEFMTAAEMDEMRNDCFWGLVVEISWRIPGA